MNYATLCSCMLTICWIINPLNTSAQSIGKIQWTESFLQEEEAVYDDRVSYGYLTVPENYEKPEGRTLKIAFIRVKAYVNPAKEDAVIYFKGGWGSRSITGIHYYLNSFLSYKRDLILYDYRGSGYSEPKLCEYLGGEVFENIIADKSYEDFESKQIQLLTGCLDGLEKEGIDFNQYGSDNKARDGILLAKALGYPSYNLFGVSYGTKAILQYLRQSTLNIRSVILDSNCPLDLSLNSRMTEDYAKSLLGVLAECEQDAKCKKKYGDLKQRFEEFLSSLDEKPLTVKLPYSRLAHLNKEEVNGVIQQMLYDENAYGTLPYVLNKFIKRNRKFVGRIVRDLEDAVLDNYNGLGLINYVYDHKPYQAEGSQLYKQAVESYPMYRIFDGYHGFFLQDQRFVANSAQTQTPKTDIPTLILAGGFDPVTPAYFSRRLRPYFSRHHYVEFPMTGHGVTDNKCGRMIAERFLNTLVDPLTDPCYARVLERKIDFYP